MAYVGYMDLAVQERPLNLIIYSLSLKFDRHLSSIAA